MNEYIDKQLATALGTMRSFCDMAEREIARPDSAEYKIGRVMHGLAWGLANATSHIDSAIAELERMRQRAEKANV